MSELIERLHHLFEFNAEAGQLIWRARPVEDFATVRGWKNFHTQFAGSVAGCINGEGYRLICVDRKLRGGHRLIWAYINGPIPVGMQVDHINGVRDDNRLENLRLVTNTENQRNSSMPRNNKSGVLGVSWHKGTLKWRAQISLDGRRKYLGSFGTLAAASDARAKALVDFGFHPSHGKVLANSPAAIRALAEEVRK
ncbi:putative NHN endonuclease [Aminobacter sp. MSH1]|uniref:HNH endonuclease signature motif containing protein n=1 Tax=Aminobacter sp. MSH1 TaxID=374606 RepID=UPI000D3B3967|nr:HNH endonuclease signature motif containing protein [Aminobacter sp. MSH1]AWC25407.1 putative NHN endonuclease [Aminobacter sp. MSH1]